MELVRTRRKNLLKEKKNQNKIPQRRVSMTRRKTPQEFEKEFYDLVGDEYEILVPYTLSKNPIRVRHNLCGREYSTPPGNFINQGKRCKSCAFTKPIEEFKREVYEMYKGLYEVIGEYVHTDKPITIRCTKHGEVMDRTPTNILRGRRVCRECNAEYLSEVQRKPTKLFDEQLLKKHKGTIVRLGEYINTHTHVGLRCLSCDFLFYSTPNSVIRVSGCPSCQESKGERTIRKYLLDNNISFQAQKKFKGCKLERELLFDFYVEDLNLIIEYDGKQHYEPIEFFGGEEAFVKQQKRDKIKNEYAKNNNIIMFRIPYTIEKEDINKHLDKFIKGGSLELVRSKAVNP